MHRHILYNHVHLIQLGALNKYQQHCCFCCCCPTPVLTRLLSQHVNGTEVDECHPARRVEVVKCVPHQRYANHAQIFQVFLVNDGLSKFQRYLFLEFLHLKYLVGRKQRHMYKLAEASARVSEPLVHVVYKGTVVLLFYNPLF